MKKILIICDDEQIISTYRKLFLAMGVEFYNIMEAPNAVMATSLLIREKIDLVLLDVQMPNMDVKIVQEVIKEYASEIDVIFSSDASIEEQKQLFPKASYYFDKSQGPLFLLDTLACVI